MGSVMTLLPTSAAHNHGDGMVTALTAVAAASQPSMGDDDDDNDDGMGIGHVVMQLPCPTRASAIPTSRWSSVAVGPAATVLLLPA